MTFEYYLHQKKRNYYLRRICLLIFDKRFLKKYRKEKNKTHLEMMFSQSIQLLPTYLHLSTVSGLAEEATFTE